MIKVSPDGIQYTSTRRFPIVFLAFAMSRLVWHGLLVGRVRRRHGQQVGRATQDAKNRLVRVAGRSPALRSGLRPRRSPPKRLPVGLVRGVDIGQVVLAELLGHDSKTLHLADVVFVRLETRHVEPFDLLEMALGVAQGGQERLHVAGRGRLVQDQARARRRQLGGGVVGEGDLVKR